MKGIILAGGSGTRLFPVTKSVSKQLLPIFDKPMIYYSLSVLLLSGIREVLLISTEKDIPMFKELLGDGGQFGLCLEYAVQKEPKGIAEAFIIAEDFINKQPVALVLGDNFFYGQGFVSVLERAAKTDDGGVIFGYYVNNPSSFGVVEFDQEYNVISLEEKPEHPLSNYAVPGLYFYDNQVVDIAKALVPSARGELEITDINLEYMKKNKLKLELFGRGMAWLDTGTHKGLLEASSFVEAIQSRQGLYIGCLEEIAYRKGYICNEKLKRIAMQYAATDYGKYLLRISDEI